METEVINNYLKFGIEKIERFLESLRSQGIVERYINQKHNYYTYTVKGRDLVNSWDDEKKEKVRQFVTSFFQPLDPEE
jgi:predicted transcriptional regulator